MANLGLIGAIGGAGAGIMANAKRKQDAIEMENKSRIDEAREKRLLEYKSEIDSGARKQEHGYNLEEIDATQTGQAKLSEQSDTRKLGAQTQSETHDTKEKQLDRESAERIADKRTTGSLSEAEVKARERFEPRTSKITTTDANGFSREEDVQAIYDKETRNTLVQSGDKFVPQGVDPAAVRPAAAGAVDNLLAHPETAIDFFEFYHYFPSRFMETLSSQRKR